jgi:hypothetical protein
MMHAPFTYYRVKELWETIFEEPAMFVINLTEDER